MDSRLSIPSTARQTQSSAAPRLTIVIPALNEAEAIESTIARTRAARDELVHSGLVTQVEIVVVSDGSEDGTPEIARRFPDVTVVEFLDEQGQPQNRGYGAAIKAGWAQGTGDLLAFLDADGTCDPRYFGPLIEKLRTDNLDVVLGSRVGPGSEMPLVRRFGNFLYALLLGLLARRRVEDTASGMRVVRRDALADLLPLPDRLHFTPAMSARALLDERVTIGEVPMAYHERTGASKLRIVQDGLRFLSIILSTCFYLRPARLTLPLGGLTLLIAMALLVGPALLYLQQHRLEEWMIYRLLVASLLGTVATMLLFATILCEQIIALSRGTHGRQIATSGIWWHWLQGKRLFLICVLLLVICGVLVGPAVPEYVATGHITLHWSRFVAGFFALLLLVQLLITVMLSTAIAGLSTQQSYRMTGLIAGVGVPDAPRPEAVALLLGHRAN